MRKVYCEIDFSLIYSAEQPDIEEFLFDSKVKSFVELQPGTFTIYFHFMKTEPGTFPFYNIVFHNI